MAVNHRGRRRIRLTFHIQLLKFMMYLVILMMKKQQNMQFDMKWSKMKMWVSKCQKQYRSYFCIYSTFRLPCSHGWCKWFCPLEISYGRGRELWEESKTWRYGAWWRCSLRVRWRACWGETKREASWPPIRARGSVAPSSSPSNQGVTTHAFPPSWNESILASFKGCLLIFVSDILEIVSLFNSFVLVYYAIFILK